MVVAFVVGARPALLRLDAVDGLVVAEARELVLSEFPTWTV